MRVLIVSSYFPPHVGGVEVVAERQARLLTRAGHDVVVATCRSEPAAPGSERQDGFTVHRLPASTIVERRLGIAYPLVGPGFVRALRPLVTWSDVVHVHDVLYQPPQVAAVLARRAGRDVYATQHVGPVNHPHPLVRGIERVVGAVGARLIARRARRVLAYNPMVAAHLHAQGVPGERVVCSSIGVDLTAFAPGDVSAAEEADLRAELGLPATTPLALFVGRMVDKKGHHQLVRAAAAEYHLVLAGPGRPGRAQPGVSYVGPLSRERLARLYRISHLFVLPSAGEVFAIAAQEAMACGLPAVLTDSPRYDAYAVDRERIALVPAEPDALRVAMTRIVTDDDLRRRMGRYSRRLAETHFDAAAGVRDLVTLYDRTAPASQQGALWTSPSSS
ncbi:MAG TPA: glycosyltransferase family 4 protein [Actinoplanes sp.]|nr:glycosyltransferase family 4 protein [Actinoplanes sp.]